MYKFRHTIKLDEYSGACVEVLVDEDDYLQIRAVDRIGDAWHHFMDAVVRAESLQREPRAHDLNREIHFVTDLFGKSS